MYDLIEQPAQSAPAGTIPLVQRDEVVQANGLGGGTKERIPDEEWDALWDGGQLYNGGGAFNNTMAGFVFEIVTYPSAAAQTSAFGADGVIYDSLATDPPKDDNTLVDGLIITGKRLAREAEFAQALASRTVTPLDDLVTYIGRVMFDDGPHKYVVLDQVGDTACDADEAWEALQQFAAPGQTGTVTNGQTSNLPFFGPVQHIVDQANHSVTNVAQPGHLFYPGSVTREVVVANGKVYIQTTGVGSGQFAGINVLGSQALWSQLDNQIAQYVDANDNGPGDC